MKTVIDFLIAPVKEVSELSLAFQKWLLQNIPVAVFGYNVELVGSSVNKFNSPGFLMYESFKEVIIDIIIT